MLYTFNRFVILFSFLGLTLVTINAQLPEKGDWKTRVGVKNPNKVSDLVWAVFENPPYNNANADLDSASFLKYYLSFGKLVDNAPYVDYTLYSGAFSEMQAGRKDFTSIYDRMISSQSDPAVKMMIVDDILKLGRNFIDNLDSVNVVRNNSPAKKGGAEDTISLPVAMTKYAHLYYKYAGNPEYYPAHLYDKVQARENFREAFRILREKNINPGDELHAFYIREYYDVCEELFLSNEEKYYDQFLEDFLEVILACDNVINPYVNIPDSIKNDLSNDKYAKYREFKTVADDRSYYIDVATGDSVLSIPWRFQRSGAAEKERIENFYGPRLNAHRKDTIFLERAVHLMTVNGITSGDVYFDYSQASYFLKKTYENCIGSALASKSYNMRQDMVDKFLEAIEVANTDVERGVVAFLIGKETNTTRPTNPNDLNEKGKAKEYGTDTPEFAEWERNMEISSANLKKVLEMQDAFMNSGKESLRRYPAHAAYQLGLVTYRLARANQSSKECKDAEEYVRMAKQMKPELYNRNADDMIANIQNAGAQFLERELLISRNAKYKKAWEKQQKEYQEKLARRKAEEDFWKQ